MNNMIVLLTLLYSEMLHPATVTKSMSNKTDGKSSLDLDVLSVDKRLSTSDTITFKAVLQSDSLLIQIPQLDLNCFHYTV
jgi:hypothetical protein